MPKRGGAHGDSAADSEIDASLLGGASRLAAENLRVLADDLEQCVQVEGSVSHATHASCSDADGV